MNHGLMDLSVKSKTIKLRKKKKKKKKIFVNLSQTKIYILAMSFVELYTHFPWVHS